jgi:hypothetical protein
MIVPSSAAIGKATESSTNVVDRSPNASPDAMISMNVWKVSPGCGRKSGLTRVKT